MNACHRIALQSGINSRQFTYSSNERDVHKPSFLRRPYLGKSRDRPPVGEEDCVTILKSACVGGRKPGHPSNRKGRMDVRRINFINMST